MGGRERWRVREGGRKGEGESEGRREERRELGMDGGSETEMDKQTETERNIGERQRLKESFTNHPYRCISREQCNLFEIAEMFPLPSR